MPPDRAAARPGAPHGASTTRRPGLLRSIANSLRGSASDAAATAARAEAEWMARHAKEAPAAIGGGLAFFPRSALKPPVAKDLEPWPIGDVLGPGGGRWRGVLSRLYSDSITFPASLSPDAGLLLYSLARNIQPRCVVETGCFLGLSTIWLAAAVGPRGGVVHSFDLFGRVTAGRWRARGTERDKEEIVRESLAAAGLEGHVHLHRGDSSTGIRSAIASGEIAEVHLAFLDGDHTPTGIWKDFLAVERALQTGGYVILHDTLPGSGHEGPRELLAEVNARATGRYEHITLYLSPVNFGMAVLRRLE